MRPTARTLWPRRDILVTLILRSGIPILLIRSRSIRFTSPWGNSEEQEMANGIFLQTNVKSMPLVTIVLSVVTVIAAECRGSPGNESGRNVFLTIELEVMMTKSVLLPPRLTLSLVQW